MAADNKKPNKQKHNWIVDAVLFAGFLVLCVVDLTGLDLHQILGAALGVLTVYHLVTHWTWVTTVTSRLFGRTSGQARLYYVLDVALALSLSGVMATGLAISTWLSLPLAGYVAWRNWHVLTTLASLVLLVVKVAVHWRWVATTAKRSFVPQRPSLVPGLLAPAPVVASDRRQFLKALGMVSGVAAFSAVHSLRVLVSGAADAEPAAVTALAALPAAAAPAATATTAATATSATTAKAAASVATATAAATATKTAAAATATPTTSTAVASAATAGSTSSCVVRCTKGCSYPGKCRRYVDSNGNRKCDLGECV